MSEKLTLREKLHIGEKNPDGEKPRMSKKLKRVIITAVCVVGVCGAVWGGLTIARNAQRGDVNVYAVNDFAMTDYWGDTSNTSGMVTTDKLQKIYISQSQTVKKVWVKEGDTVKKGTALVSYDSTLTQATVERAKIDYDRQVENLEVMKNELELLKKAKNKETLQAEYDKLEKELNKLIEDATKSPDDDKDVKDLTHIAIDGMKLGTGSGNDKDNAIYYYRTTDSDGGFALSQADLMRIFSSLGKTDGTLYLVFVTRAGNKLGGAVMGNEGYILTAVTEDVPSGGETGGETQDPQQPPAGTGEGGEGSETSGTTAKKLVSVTVKPWNGFKPFTDGAPDYGDKKAEIEKLQRQMAQVQELLDASMTQLDLNKAILEKAQAVKEQEVNLKVAKLKLDKKLAELGDGNVYAEFDGTVKAVRDPDEAYNNSEAVVELSGGGGYYVTGTLSEMDLGSVQVGDSVSISSWMTGAACEGTIVSIDDYPTSNGNNWGDGNSNVSYYPFKVFVTEDANLQPNDYVDIQYQKDTSAEESGSSLYLESMFIRTDNGKSYVMARGEDGRLEQRWVQTGRDLWGSYTQIRGGLTIDDYVAFPYGRDVVEGAHTQEATADQLYNYGI